MNSILRRHDSVEMRFSQRPESSSVVVVQFPNKLNVWSSRFSHFVPFSNKLIVWKTRFLSRPEFSGLHRNDKKRGGWGIKKGAEALLQHLFLPLTSILTVIPISGENL